MNKILTQNIDKSEKITYNTLKGVNYMLIIFKVYNFLSFDQ